MANFYIDKLIVTGKEKGTSIIEFSDGLNIICGPSNTGKSYIVECIDFLFGSDKSPFDPNMGYDCVKLLVLTKTGNITLERKLNSRKIKVSSADKNIDSGDYSTSKGKQRIGDIWLRLIGIEEDHHIIKNKNFEKQRLSWRMFLHIFLIKEGDISQKPSILTPKQKVAEPAALAALLFLITGRDFTDTDPREDKKIKEAKKKAVIAYINSSLANLTERKGELDNMPTDDALSLQAKVEAVLDEIAETERQIAAAANRNRTFLREIFAVNEQLTECNTLYNRYQALRSQYSADIKRLTFIVEGELCKNGMVPNEKCPFCDGDISAHEEHSYVEASEAELARIRLQLEDLSEAERDIINERAALETKSIALNEEKSGIEDLLNNKLKPEVAFLKQTLSAYRQAIEIQNEAILIQKFADSMKNELFEYEKEEESELEFKVKSHFDSVIIETIERYLNRILKSCKYENLLTAHFNISSFDVVVDGKSKETEGKGYRAFLNTVLAITFMEYLSHHGKYKPEFLVIDSPILSLKERTSEKASDSMKSALFKYLIDNQNSGQVIIVENDLPNLDYSGANVISFTKDPSHGRYGFLNGMR